MAFLDVVAGAVFIFDAFSVGDIFLSLRITPALFPSCFSTQHCISPTLYFSPVSVHNIVYHPRSISLLFQYTTLHITHALFLSCFSTQHCISPTALFVSCFSTRHSISARCRILCCFIYRVSQEDWTKLRESVPYIKI